MQNILNTERLTHSIEQTNTWMFGDYDCDLTILLRVGSVALTVLSAGTGYLVAIPIFYIMDWYADARERERFSQLFVPNPLEGVLPTNIPLAPIRVARHEAPVEVPRTLLSNSFILKGLVEEDEDETPAIGVPNGLSLNDVIRYLPLLNEETNFSSYSKHGLAVMLNLAHYLDCPSIAKTILEQYPFPALIPHIDHSTHPTYAVSIDQIEEVLGLCDRVPPKCIAPSISFYISHYIRYQLVQYVSQVRICSSLSALPVFRRHIADIPLTLDLGGQFRNLDKHFLQQLAKLCPQIVALSLYDVFHSWSGPLSGEEFETAFPRLTKLNIMGSNILLSLSSQTVERLTELHAGGYSPSPRIDLSRHQELPFLEHLYIDHVYNKTILLPNHCPNLKSFSYHKRIPSSDLSFLSSSKSLERLQLVCSDGSITPPSLDSFPHLKSFRLASEQDIDPNIVAPLNDHKDLEEIVLFDTKTCAVVNFPHPIGCPKLTVVTTPNFEQLFKVGFSTFHSNQ